MSWADVIGEAFPTGVVERLGLGYEELKKVKPDIIMLRSCGYGHTGPMAKQPGFGMTLSAYAMMYSLAGWPDRAVPRIQLLLRPAISIIWYAGSGFRTGLSPPDR